MAVAPAKDEFAFCCLMSAFHKINYFGLKTLQRRQQIFSKLHILHKTVLPSD